ncbi:zinc ribbon-containing protein [Marinobacter caseinilyticus]|uniref:zinc ribbon-containing protein n=1 Tax=Marinobacter caseinilyticus TaxID=2692195 RepID=UPI00140C3911|nr:zinc ribbon-containing protein [Marinobacter caseinilyticus]
MANHERNAFSGQALKVYNRMMERVEARLGELENRTRESLREEIENAVEFENELEEMTRDEINLLAAYLRRDLEHLLHFVDETGEGVGEWLRLDLSLVERQLSDMLFSIADKSQLDTLELDQKIHNKDVSHYISGEVATAGVLRCLSCGHMRCLTKTSHIEPCEACNSHYFERITSRWPHDENE